MQLALQTFENFGMVEIIDGVITIPNWGKHQNLDQLEKKRVSQREYMRQYRERQKLLSCNANGKANGKTNVSRPEEDIEEDKKENKSVRETTHTLFVRLLPDYLLSDSLQAKMGEWVKYKTERKEPYKEQGMKSLLRQVENKAIQYGDDAVCSLIDECMANNWKGIIFDRLQQSQRKPASGGYHRQTKAEELNDFYTMAENWSET